jgi:hypothetical protein
MRLKSMAVYTLVAMLFASVASAQATPDIWRSYAERLPPGSYIVVHLVNGASIQGHLVEVTDDRILVLPKTRLPVPARNVALADIQSIDARREGWSPGMKVLTGAGVSAAVIFLITIALLSGST